MAHFRSSLGTRSLFLLILYSAIPIFSLTVPFHNPSPESSVSQVNLSLVRRTNGNPNIAGDLYGVGLRVGAYLQIFGMLLSCIRSENRSRAGILLLSSAVCLSLFFALSIVVARREISPCEAWLVLTLAAAYGSPRFCAVNEDNKPKAGIATVCCLVSLLWQQVFYFWFWTTGYRKLPLLGTDNQVWFFAPVDLAGWFRIFMLVVTCLETFVTAASIGPYVDLILIRFVYWTGAEDEDQVVEVEDESLAESEPLADGHPADGKTPSKNCWYSTLLATGRLAQALQQKPYYESFVTFGDKVLNSIINGDIIRVWRMVSVIRHRRRVSHDGPEIFATPQPKTRGLEDRLREETAVYEAKKAKAEKIDRELRRRKLLMVLTGFIILVLTISGIEKIIEYNSLSPTSDLSAPGQIIPFVLGIITLVVGASHAIKPQIPQSTSPPESRQVQEPVSSSGIGLPPSDSETQWIDLTTTVGPAAKEESFDIDAIKQLRIGQGR